MASADLIEREVREAWRPPRRMTLSEWADAHAYLSAESAAQEGRWRTLPYQRGLMDAMTDPTIEMVVFQKSARVGYTKCLNNLIGYHIHQDPCPIMVVQPTESDAEGYSKEEIAPMLRDTPVLQGVVADAKSRDSGNTVLDKRFPGGGLSLVGANSPRGFRRVSRRVVLFDEVDGYPLSAGAEGDPIKLGIRRSEYYWNRKIVAGSTPTVKDISRIESLFAETDQRRYFVPCPHCGEEQFLVWGAKVEHGIKWPSGRPQEAVYICQHCGAAIRHSQKYDMIEAGAWQPTAQARRQGLAGFHLWAAYSYSPNATWGQLAQEWVDAQGRPELLKTFVNTVLGETWEENYTARLDAHDLAQRAESYELLHAPLGVLVATCGIDVQPNRVEIQTVGWGEGEEAWVLNYAVVWGDPTRFELWGQVWDVIRTPVRHASGVMLQPYTALVDSGDGNLTNEVYTFAREHRDQHVLAIKGFGGTRPPIGLPSKQDINIRGQKIEKGAVLYPVGVDAIKSTIYGRLKRAEKEGPGVVHFPLGLHEDYFKQLTAEKQATKFINGMPRRYWVKQDGDRNEALDTFVYAYAGLHYAYTRHNRATFWRQMRASLEQKASGLATQLAAVAESDADAPPEALPVVVQHGAGKISLDGFRRHAR
jgi:phage terminase large subunit GpA-like protein